MDSGTPSLWGTWDYWEPEPKKDLTKKCSCECGTIITYGKEVPEEFHSDWCPIKKKLNEDV